jgi:hypothetical protein
MSWKIGDRVKVKALTLEKYGDAIKVAGCYGTITVIGKRHYGKSAVNIKIDKCDHEYSRCTWTTCIGAFKSETPPTLITTKLRKAAQGSK